MKNISDNKLNIHLTTYNYLNNKKYKHIERNKRQKNCIVKYFIKVII